MTQKKDQIFLITPQIMIFTNRKKTQISKIFNCGFQN